jgi:carboxylesterase type B
MLLSSAYGGGLNTSLWRAAISNSPYSPPQYNFDDEVPQSYYDHLIKATDCADKSNSFTCLSAVPYEELFAAGAKLIKETAPYGTWGPAPVTDNELIRASPAKSLVSGKVNGEYMFTGNMGSEGSVFVSPDITTGEDFEKWFHQLYPSLDKETYQRAIRFYPEPEESGGLYATQVERAAKLYGDWTFDCPSYWLATSFEPGKAWKYVDDVQPAFHARDLQTFFLGPTFPDFGTDMASQRAVIVGSLSAFWTNFDPARNPALTGIDYLPFDASNKYPELRYDLTDAGKTKASVRELNAPFPEVCKLPKEIL